MHTRFDVHISIMGKTHMILTVGETYDEALFMRDALARLNPELDIHIAIV